MKIVLSFLLLMVLLIPLIILQAVIFLLGGWTMDKYTRPNVVFGFMDWLDL